MRKIIAFAVVGGLTLTACSSTGGSETAPLPAKRARAEASTSSTTAPFASDTTHTPGSRRTFDGARADVHDTSCAAKDGRWIAAGKVTNPTGAAVRYRIYVSFLDGDTTAGITETNTGSVAAKTTADWKASLKLATPGLRCILRVERTDA